MQMGPGNLGSVGSNKEIHPQIEQPTKSNQTDNNEVGALVY